MIPKCAKCGLNHTMDIGNSPIQKCANCKGDHLSTFPECPKRKEFMQMRSRLASAKNKKSNKPTPAPMKRIDNFPILDKTSSSNPNHQNQNPSRIADWSKIVKHNTNHPETANVTNSEKFKIDEIGPIMKDLLSGLRVCHNKEEQLIIMFEIATKWIYNNVP